MEKERFIAQLLTWYYKEKRDLPWRREKDPYRIWVSEVMLQQTRVETVIPYYERFMERFPTLQQLAEADEEEVLKYWEGLGYYSRARNLLMAVREVQERYGGTVPDQEEEIEKLKGIGSYTKGAILSIAFNKPVPAVDGNVMRVMSRILAMEKDISQQSAKREIENLIRQIIPEQDPSGFNQALMELGALICLPRSPRCGECPVENECQARRQGKERLLPIKTRKERKREILLLSLVLIHDGKVLIHRRAENLLKGMWEFPTLEMSGQGKMDAQNLACLVLEKYGISSERFCFLGRVTHIFSHLQWKMQAWLGEVEEMDRSRLDDDYAWVDIDQLDRYPFPVPHQKIREKWEKYQSHPSA